MERFLVSNEGAYGGGSELAHDFEKCDWAPCIDGLNLLQVLAVAEEHLAACNGQRQPIPARVELSPAGKLVADAWGPQIAASLRATRRLVSAPGTGADGA